MGKVVQQMRLMGKWSERKFIKRVNRVQFIVRIAFFLGLSAFLLGCGLTDNVAKEVAQRAAVYGAKKALQSSTNTVEDQATKSSATGGSAFVRPIIDVRKYCRLVSGSAVRNCSGKNFSGADLSNQDLSDVDFQGANLSGTDLSNSILRDANLANADLTGSILAGADVSGANFSGALLKNVLMPDGSVHD